MRKSPVFRNTLCLLTALALLTGCNMPTSASQTTPDITQAYQTVQARLTQAATGSPAAAAAAPTVAPATPTPLASATPEAATPSATPRPTTVPPTAPAKICDQAAAGSPLDVTIPDGTRMTPGQTFTKTWRLYNNGTCTWTTEYTLALFSGEDMDSPAGINLPKAVAPGESVDVSVELTAPDATGTAGGNWKLRNTAGTWCGIGPGGASPCWVESTVAGTASVSATPTGTNNPNVTRTPYPDGSAPGETVTGSGSLKPGEALDLDTSVMNAAGADVLFKVNAQGKPGLAAQGGANLAVMGFKQPTYAECKSSGLGGGTIQLKDLSGGQYLCYKTNQGNYGWLYLASWDQDNALLGIQMNTWINP